MRNLATERLVLKLYAPADKEKFIALFTDERVMKHVDTGVFSKEKAEALWKKLLDDFCPAGVQSSWAVFAGDDSRYVGHASLRPRSSKKEDWEIGYILRAEEWGKGFATEIARELIEFGFRELNLPEVWATVDDDNFASLRVLEKAGMSFRDYEYDEQGRFSVYSIKF